LAYYALGESERVLPWDEEEICAAAVPPLNDNKNACARRPAKEEQASLCAIKRFRKKLLTKKQQRKTRGKKHPKETCPL
jgi:hypothetical protein